MSLTNGGINVMRFLRVPLLLVACGLLVPSAVADVACAAHRRTPGGWTTVAAPRFAAGPPSMTGYDVADRSAASLLATNGAAVAASADGGCTWATAALDDSVPDAAVGSDGAEVVARTVDQVLFAAGTTDVAWTIGRSEVGSGSIRLTRPRVLRSDDGGRRFRPVLDGLPEIGRPVALAALSDGRAVLLLEEAPTGRYEIYVGDGTRWLRRWGNLPELYGVAVDAASPRGAADPRVYAWGIDGVRVASLGAAVLRKLPTPSMPVRVVDLAVSRGAPAVVCVYLAGAAERLVSFDDGRTFTAQPTRPDVSGASTYQPAPHVRALSTTAGDVLIETPSGLIDVSPRDVAVTAPHFVSTRTAQGLPLYALHPDALYLRHVPAAYAAERPSLRPPPVPLHPSRLRPRPAAIAPREVVVRLQHGQRRVVPYRVDLPAVPPPLDVFFVTDSTGSMGTTMAAVREGFQTIVDRLGARGISAHFGVADFRDYPVRPDDTANFAYQRRRAVGPVNAELAEVLEALTTGGGNGETGRTAGLEAIYQAATGAGRVDPLRTRGFLVPPGNDARFRASAKKVVVVAADDEFRHADPAAPQYPVPSIDAVSAALRSRGINVVGLEVDTGSGTARPDMERLARETGTVATGDGVDCDGDGAADVRPGAPIVCAFDPKSAGTLPGTLVAMVRGLTAPAEVRFAVAAPPDVARALVPLRPVAVDAMVARTFALPVEFRCAAPGTTRVRVTVTVRGIEVAQAGAVVRCAAPPGSADAADPDRTTSRPVFGGLPAPPVAPAPAPPNPGPHPNPNPNPQPNAQPHGNVGVAAQADERTAVALATDDVPDADLAMSRLSPQPLHTTAIAAVMTAVAARALRSQARRDSPATASWGRHRSYR